MSHCLLRIPSFVVCLLLNATAIAQQPADLFLGRSVAQYQADLKSDSAQTRHLAAWSLAQMGAPAEEALIAALTRGDHTVRYWAVHGLSRIALASPANSPKRQELTAVIHTLLNDNATAVRLAAAEAHVRLGRTDTGVTILARSLADPQEATRIAAIESLARLGPLAAPAKAKIESATSDPSEYVKRIAARWLAAQTQASP